MAIQTQRIGYRHGDTELEGFLAWNDSSPDPRPGIAIAHTAGGLKDFECDKARRLAELGFTAFAVDMYGKGVRTDDRSRFKELTGPFMADRALLQQRINLAIDVLGEQPQVDEQRIAAIGFCFGGLCVLDLARSGRDVGGVVSFHGLFTPPETPPNRPIQARVLCLHGYDDPMVKPAEVTALADELTSAGADWQIHAYGNTMHAFTNPAADNPDIGTVYEPKADKRSWKAMLDFLEEVFE